MIPLPAYNSFSRSNGVWNDYLCAIGIYCAKRKIPRLRCRSVLRARIQYRRFAYIWKTYERSGRASSNTPNSKSAARARSPGSTHHHHRCIVHCYVQSVATFLKAHIYALLIV